MIDIRAIYTKYTRGDWITDAELDQLLLAIEAALPYLEASPSFSLVCREALTDLRALSGYREARERREPRDSALPPVQFIAIVKRHIGVQPIKYRHHPGTETPHLFTFPLTGRSSAGHTVMSFSINAADLRILMDAHGLLRMQSNDPGEITLYFSETPK